MSIYSGIHISEVDDKIEGMMKKWGIEYFLCRNGGWVEGIPFKKSTKSIRDKKNNWGFRDEYGRECNSYFYKDFQSYSNHIPLFSNGVTSEDMDYFWDWKKEEVE